MGEIGLYSVGFYVWWIFLNGFLCFLKCCFYRTLLESGRKRMCGLCFVSTA